MAEDVILSVKNISKSFGVSTSWKPTTAAKSIIWENL